MNAQTPLFQHQQITYTWHDVALAAKLRGDWHATYANTARSLVLTQHARTQQQLPSQLDLQAAERDFCHRHQLLHLDALHAWLERWNITEHDWQEHLLRMCVNHQHMHTVVAIDSLDERDIEAHVWIDVVCTQTLREWVHACAGRIALRDSLLPLVDPAELATRTQLILESAALHADHVHLLAEAEALFEIHHTRVESSPRVNEIIQRQLRAWTRFQYQALRFHDEKRARHASHCLLGDGVSISDVARIAKANVVNGDCYFEELPRDFRFAFANAQTGDLLPTVAHNDDYWVIAVTHCTPPALDCPLTRLRAVEEALSSDIEHACRNRITWLDR